jgi:hypothetical protein
VLIIWVLCLGRHARVVDTAVGEGRFWWDRGGSWHDTHITSTWGARHMGFVPGQARGGGGNVRWGGLMQVATASSTVKLESWHMHETHTTSTGVLACVCVVQREGAQGGGNGRRGWSR